MHLQQAKLIFTTLLLILSLPLISHANQTVTIDNDAPTNTKTGYWLSSDDFQNTYGTSTDYHAPGTGDNVFTWNIPITSPGVYEVYVNYPDIGSLASSDAKYTISHSAASDVVTVNQQQNSGQWQLLGTYTFNIGNAEVSLSDLASNYVAADAVQFVQVPVPTPLAHWPFDENSGHIAEDDSGNGHHAELINGASFGDVITNAAILDGNDDYINAGSDSGLDDIQLKTIVGWVKRKDLSQNQYLMLKGYTGGPGGWGLYTRRNTGGASANRIVYEHQWSGSIALSAIWYGSSVLDQADTWYHIAIVYDANSQNNAPLMYLNGNAETVTVEQASVGNSSSDAANNLTIGGVPGQTAHADFDDIYIFDRALTSAEIQQLYQLGAPSNTPPVANAGDDQTVNSGATVALNGSGSTDADGDTLTYSWTQSAGTTVTLTGADTATPSFTAPLGPDTLSFVLVVDDGQGDTSQDTVTITVNPNNPPSISTPANITNYEATGPLTTVALGAASANDVEDGALTPTNNAPTAGFPVGTTTVTWSVTDSFGATTNAQQTVQIVDTTAPSITPPPNITAYEATAVLSSIPDLGTATAHDIVDGPLTPSNNSPVLFPVGTANVTWSATDAAGNNSTAIQTVQVVDTTAPNITAPADITLVSSTPLPRASVNLGTPTTTDIFPITTTDNAPSTFGLGATTVTWTATDSNGNSATATQIVTINPPPNTDPIANAGPDQTVESNASVSLNGSGSNDPDGDTLMYSWVQIGTPTVPLTDANTATPSFTAPVGPAVLTFELTVDDNRGGNHTDTVTITVNPPAASGPLGHWTFDEGSGSSAADSSGNGYTGNLLNGPTWTNGAVNGALALDGVNDYVDVGSANGLDDIPVKTIAGWVKRKDLSRSQQIMMKGYTGGQGGWEFYVRPNNGGASSNRIGYAHQWDGSTWSSALWYGSTNLDQADTWYHVAIVYDASATNNAPTIYLNGTAETVTVENPAVGNEATDAANNLTIGGVSGETAHADLDDVRIYNRALTATEIQQLYNLGQPGNNPPVANAGNNQTVNSGALVNLDGTGSTDADGDTLSYSWVQTAGTPTITLTDANTATPSFIAPASGTFTFQLTVDDGSHSDTDSVTITVSVPGNNPPVASAGPDQAVNSGVTVNLDGSASTDPDGDTLTYSWIQTGGTTQVSLSGANTVSPSFTAPTVSDTLTFQVTVDDGNGLTHTDSVVIVVASNAWSVQRNFDAGPVGALATVANDGFDGVSFATYDNNVRPQSSGLSARAGILTGRTFWGGQVDFPAVQKGDKLWLELYLRIPTGFQTVSGNGSLKFIRIGSSASNTTPLNSGTIDIQWADDGVGPHEFRMIRESVNVWYEFGQDGDLVRDVWHRVNVEISFDNVPVSQGGNGYLKFWLNGQLLIDNPQMQTLAFGPEQHDQLLLLSYYNNGSPQDQHVWLDDVSLTNTPPAWLSEMGN